MNGSPIGHLIVWRGENEHRLVDIALISAVRSQGIGRSLIEEILVDAESAGKPVILHVGIDNPAVQLYQRIGFQIVANTGSHYRMKWMSRKQ
jgi:ribosomal protein S18 acetylase RimI-like enzyme